MKNLILVVLLAFSFTAAYAEDIKTNVQTTQKVKVAEDFSSEYKEETTDFDPLSGYNRVMTSFNDFFYVNILEPTAEGYAYIVPEPARIGISNFLHNLMFPIRLLNNLLQFKFENALEETGRFLVNSTFGLLGVMDPATDELNMEEHNEDFGQTLGFYGIGEGFPIVLPFLGPSNLRDTIGLVGDAYINPLTDISALDYKIPDNMGQTIAITTFQTVNRTSLRLGQYENLKRDAIDLYPFLQDIYNQNREKEIKE